MKIQNYGRGILHVTNPDPRELAYGFLRIQESSGNPAWIGKGTFDRRNFLDWYDRVRAEEQDPRWPYHEEYVGFSVESSALRPFYRGTFGPLEIEEKALLGLLAIPTNEGRKRAFVIGTTEGDLATMDHELSRAFSHVSSTYNERTLALIRDIPSGLRYRMEKWFIDDGSFMPEVIPAEIVAEFADWRDSYMFKEAGLDKRDKDLQWVHRGIRKAFEREHAKLKLDQ